MELWLVRTLHITGGVLWAGWAAFLGFYALPAIRESGPGGGAVMGGIVKRKLPLAMNLLAVVTLLTGLRLYSMVVSGGWIKTGPGICLTIGAVLALGGFAVGMFVSRPTAGKLGALGAAVKASGGPPSAEQAAEMQALLAKAERAGRVVAYHLTGAAVFMAMSRFFPF
jgi:hypothetical protein